MSTSSKKEIAIEAVSAEKKTVLFEIAWEVCNQVGGIYTVIRSKVPAMVERWGNDYCLIGPYFPNTANIEFEPITDFDDSPFGLAAQNMIADGHEVYYGRWLVTGNPRIILIDFKTQLADVNQLKHRLWQNHKISTLNAETLVDDVIAFGEMVRIYLTDFAVNNKNTINTIAHFHEWMAATALIDIRKENIPIATVFTTHATMLGRYIAGNVADFYDKLPTFNWAVEAKNYGIEAQAGIEHAAGQLCHVLSTVSDVTAKECEVFLAEKST